MKIKKLKLLFVLVIVCHTITTLSMPAYPGLIKMKQPDGTTISLYLKGDEKVHWMESEDGYSLMYDNNKTIVYAMPDENGGMAPSSVAVRDISLRSPSDQSFLKAIPPKLKYSADQVVMLKSIWKFMPESTGGSTPIRLRSSIGVAHAICALVDFPDKPFTKSISDFDMLMNQAGYKASGAVGSVHDYYYENSYGKLDLIITVVGIYRLPKNSDYYGANSSSGQDIPSRVQEFAMAAAQLTFTGLSNIADFDNDGDGYIDAFHIIYAGHGEEAGGGDNCIWAHEFQFPTQTYGTKKIKTYSCSPELRGGSGSSITFIGPVCHEMCHIFGSPDFYDTDYSGFDGTGQWDLMAGGSWNDNGASPAHINMYEKIQLGWVVPETLNQMQVVTGMLNSANNPVAYRYDTPTAGEYYILENRQKVGFDSYVPGTGLLIYHVSLTSSDISSNTVNDKHPQKMYPVCASATTNPTATPASYGNINSNGCPFPGSSNNKSFTDYTMPAAVAWNGANTNKPVTQIQEQSGVISFNFLKPDPDQTNNFQATVVNQSNVKLTWEKPAEDGVIGYNIYRDDQLQIQLTGQDNTSYTQYNVKSGNYNYCVSALYSDKESASVCKSVQILNSPIDNSYLSVKNLGVQSMDNNIELNWKSPFENSWSSIGGDFQKCFNPTSYNPFIAAVKFTSDDLLAFSGSKLTKVRFVMSNLQCKYSIQVWLTNAGSPNPTSNPITDQLVNNPTTPNDSFEVTLDTPVDLGTNKDLWIGIKYELSPMTSVAGVDQGPIVSNRNYLYYNNKWSAVPAINNLNWVIAGYFQYDNSPLSSQENSLLRATSATPTPQNYVVYRDNTKIGTTTQPQYIDTPPTSDYHVYCISVAYTDGKESEPVCIEASTDVITSLDPVNNMENEINIYPNPIQKGETLVINCDPNTVSTLSIYTVSGQLLQHEKITGPVSYKKMDFEPGIYILQIKNDSKAFMRKIIVK